MAPRGHPGRPGRLSGRTRALALAASVVSVVAGAALAFGAGSTASAAPGGPPKVAAQVPVTMTDLTARPSNNSPQLAVDPTDSRFVVIANRLDAPFNCALQLSGDGGRGWITVRPVPKLPKGADSCYGPEVAFGSDGLLYYLFVGLESKGNSPVGAYLTTSSDRGRTFSTPHQILGAERYQVRMVLDSTRGNPGRLYIVWLEAGTAAPTGGLPATTNPILSAHSDDGGKTFSTPVRISDPERTRAVAPAVALGPDHAIDVVYYDLNDDSRDYQGLDGPRWDGKWTLVLTRSTDGGDHFSRGSVVDADLAPPERVMLIFTMPPPALAVDPSGRLFVAWYDNRNGDWDAFLRRSTDDGRSWERPLRLNDDQIHNGRNQYLPRLSVSPSGRIDAIFYDRRSNAENIGVDVYYTYSADGGRTFSPNVQLNQVTFSSIVGPRYTAISARHLIEFGSRIALTSTDDRVLAAWTDTTNDRPGIKAQDIMATEIDLPGGSGGPPWGRIIGICLVIAGALGLGMIVWSWRPARPAAAAKRDRRGVRPG